MTRGAELPAEKVFKEDGDRNPVRSYLRIFRLKPMLWLLGLTIMFFIGYTVYESGLAYYVLYCAGLSEGAMSTAMLLNIFISIVMTAIISKFTQYTDQRIAMAVCFAIAAACFSL